MSRIAKRACWSTMASSSVSMTTWLRALSSVPISGTPTTPSHSLITGVATLSSWSCCRSMSACPSDSAVSSTTSRSVPISTVSAVVHSRTCSAAVSGNSSTRKSATGGRRASTSADTWAMVIPARERAAAMRANCSRTTANPVASVSYTRSDSATWANASITVRAASTASSRERVNTLRNSGSSAQRWAIRSRWRYRKSPTTCADEPRRTAASCSGTCSHLIRVVRSRDPRWPKSGRR